MHAWSHNLERKDFLLQRTYLQKTLQIFTYVFDWLQFTQLSYFFFLYRSPLSSLCIVFYSVSSNLDDVLLINPSADVFVFRDFNIHLKDWLTYSGGTDRPGELCYNFSISSNLTPMVNFPTLISDCDSGFLSSDASMAYIYSTVAFPNGKS